ncbi:MAG: GNAT family protein [archaeon]
MKLFSIETERLLLRPMRLSDAEEFLPMINDNKISNWIMLSPPISLKKERAYVRKSRRKWKQGKEFGFAVVLRENGELIGAAGTHRIDRENSQVELGIFLARSWHGKGCGKEAVSALLWLAFKKLKLHRIVYKVFEGNEASRNLISKLGGKEEGFLRESVRKKSKFVSAHVYAVLKKEWKQRGKAKVIPQGK